MAGDGHGANQLPTDEHPSGEALAALARRIPPGVRFGTSSWTYPGWRGLVYPADAPAKRAPATMLAEYARFPLFGTVGIDSSFYRPLEPDTLESYARALPPSFPCVSKVWDRLTVHTFSGARYAGQEGQRNPDYLNANLFLDAVYESHQQHFAGHTGPFVFEFQASGPRSGETANAFADRLDRFFSELPRDGQYAVELRTPEFLTPAYFAVLRAHGVAHVLNSWTRMPSIGEQIDVPDVVTGPFLLARVLLRPGRQYHESVERFEPFDRIREPNPELRSDIVRLVQAAIDLGLPAYILVNNRAEGCAPLTIAAAIAQLTGT